MYQIWGGIYASMVIFKCSINIYASFKKCINQEKKIYNVNLSKGLGLYLYSYRVILCYTQVKRTKCKILYVIFIKYVYKILTKNSLKGNIQWHCVVREFFFYFAAGFHFFEKMEPYYFYCEENAHQRKSIAITLVIFI